MQSCNWRVEPFKNCLMRIFIKNINLIISDDNSNDSTRKILEEYKKIDNRIKIYLQDKINRGNDTVQKQTG